MNRFLLLELGIFQTRLFCMFLLEQVGRIVQKWHNFVAMFFLEFCAYNLLLRPIETVSWLSGLEHTKHSSSVVELSEFGFESRS